MILDARGTRSQGSVHMDAVRGLAAILVMLGHSRDLFFQSLNGATDIDSRVRITMGNEAVMIFFVLSGYLVGGSVLRSFQRRSWSWKDYLTKRLTRLWMVLLPALTLTVILDNAGLRLFPEVTGIYHAPPGQHEVLANTLETLTPRVAVGNAFFLQNILVPTLGTNIALWSLSNEFWYYLIFPLLVVAFWKSSSTGARAGSALLAVVLLYFIGIHEASLFPVWLLGVVVSLLPLRLSEHLSRWLLSGFSLLLLPIMVMVRRLPVNIYWAEVIIALYFTIMLYLMLNRRRQAARGIYQRVAAVLSDLSYPLYLVHLPILIFLCAAINQPWRQFPRTAAYVGLMLGIDAVTIAAAFLFHLLFQRHTDAVRKSIQARL